MASVFEPFQHKNYPFVYNGSLHLASIGGGVPMNPDVLEGHLKRKTAESDDLIRAEVAQLMVEEGKTADEAIEEAARMKGLIGFKNDPEHGLYIGGFQLKACLAEAASIAASENRIAQKWGEMSKQGKALKGWFPEHVFVRDDRLYLGVTEPTEVVQSFVHKMSPKGPISAIQYTEVVRDVDVPFTIETDHQFEDDEIAAIWTTAERMGLGAGRKMGYGRFEVRRWDLAPARTRAAKAARRPRRAAIAA